MHTLLNCLLQDCTLNNIISGFFVILLCFVCFLFVCLFVWLVFLLSFYFLSEELTPSILEVTPETSNLIIMYFYLFIVYSNFSTYKTNGYICKQRRKVSLIIRSTLMGKWKH